MKTLERKYSVILTVLIVLITIFGPIGCGGSAEQGLASGIMSAPDFELESLTGGRVRLSDYLGRVVILNFWATWCRPCVLETPDLVDLYNNYRERGLMVLGVSVDQNPRSVLQPFIQRYQIGYPILLNDQRAAAAYGGITSIPTTFLIDRQGMIRKQYVGYQQKSVVEEAIKELL